MRAVFRLAVFLCLAFCAAAQSETVEMELVEIDDILFYDGEATPAESAAAQGGSENLYRPLELGGANHGLVEKWRASFLSPSKVKWISDILSDAEHFRLYVRQKLAERNMPALLEFLPIVESDYNVNALSKSGALGMWQFMENSIRPFLTKNDFVDERLDPWKATDAALSKLQDNYNMFGDWTLAITAYNCGVGALSGALKKSPEKNFWYLAENDMISNESKNYIPKLLAIADIVQNSGYYGVEFPEISAETEQYLAALTNSFDYVTVSKSYSIRRLAAEMRMDEATLVALNSALTRGVTPPHSEYEIRLPFGMRQSAVDALAEIQPWGFTERYVVQKGDTLWALARSNNTTVAELCAANGISEKAVLQIGKVLYLPQK